ncbi:hypothetical protein ABPG74_007460 [Tetrahymena malaccensis]
MIQLNQQYNKEVELMISSLNNQTAVGVNDQAQLKELCTALTKTPHLSKIQIYFAEKIIDDQGISDLSIALSSLPNVSYLLLELFNNNIGKLGAQRLADYLKNQKQLEILQLNLSAINHQEAYELGSVLAQLKNLESLNLNLKDNLIEAQGAQSLFSELQACQNIQNLTLQLQGTQIGIEGLQSLFNFISKCNLLSKLDLNVCHQIKDECASALGITLEQCQNLSKIILNLDYCQISDEGIKSISQSLLRCPQLSELSLSIIENIFGIEGARQLYTNLALCDKLSILNLNLGRNYPSQGDLDGEIVEFDCLTEIIANAKQIVQFNIQANQYFY